MASQSQPSTTPQIYFFPFVGGGHIIPIIDLARLFASHGAAATILLVPTDVPTFQNTIFRDQSCGLPIHLHPFSLPPSSTLDAADMSAPPLTDTSALHEPLRHLLLDHPPDCIITDTFHRWATDLIDSIGIPRIIFNGNCCFARCCEYSLNLHSPHTKVKSDSEYFLLPGLPDKVELCRSQLSVFFRNEAEFPGKSRKAEENCFGRVINSFHALEFNYIDYYRNVMGKKAWIVGPVSLHNRKMEDKLERGQRAAIDEHVCLNWLDSRSPNSVVYISFGSLARISRSQIDEIASGLESSGHHFIWVIGKVLDCDNETGGFNFPDGFEERLARSGQGLLIKGWAPQLLILEHGSVGGFVTHCGWNSTLESVCAGVPMITWPLSAEQFYNEKLVTDVLRIGLRVGNEEWGSWNAARKTIVGRERVEAAVRRLMGGASFQEEMRRRSEELAAEARRAVANGGSSFCDVEGLIEEIKSCKKKNYSN